MTTSTNTPLKSVLFYILLTKNILGIIVVDCIWVNFSVYKSVSKKEKSLVTLTWEYEHHLSSLWVSYAKICLVKHKTDG